MPASGNLKDGTLGRRTIGVVDLLTIPSNRIFNESIEKQQLRDFHAHHMTQMGLTLWGPEKPGRSPNSTAAAVCLPGPAGQGPPDEVATLENALLPENREALTSTQPMPTALISPQGRGNTEFLPEQPVEKNHRTKALARSLGLSLASRPSSVPASRRQKAKPDRCPPMEQFYDFSCIYKRPRVRPQQRSSSQGHLQTVTRYPDLR
eukprot:gb/GFBE01003183.1/.p1 GENE.gb/GFBE01003183.1/~~gb/GFBE01003183.1/.p1  ORF type:complete len:206 (+),score=18.62 gb/GFBE01003183.1/:1-618(+)